MAESSLNTDMSLISLSISIVFIHLYDIFLGHSIMSCVQLELNVSDILLRN